MTLVASLLVDNHPILLGDLMTSDVRRAPSHEPFPTPLHADPNREVRDGHSNIVAGLKQKVNVLTPRLAVAWSGEMSKARYAVPTLRDNIVDAGYTISGLERSLERLSRSCNSLYLTGIMTLAKHESDLPCISFSWPKGCGKRLASPMFGDCRIGGTGAGDFGKLILAREQSSATIDGQPNGCARAILESFSMTARLSGDQMRCGSGLRHFYGGGFEIATLIGGVFTKVGDVAYHLWDARMSDDGQVPVTLHSALKYSYDGDLLLVRKVDPALPTDELFVVLPVHKTLAGDEKAELAERVTPPPLDSEFNLFYLHIPQAPPASRITVLSHYRGTDEKSSVLCREFDDHLELELSPDLLRRVADVVQRAIAK